jgi:V8-like Glu-specific endopeptidase
VGTASLIGNNVILTSAFNCYDAHQRKKTSNIVFTPGCFKGKGKEQFKAKNIYFPEELEKIDLDD